MARALEIPAIVGLHDITSQVSTGDEILLDGNKGILIIRPTKEQLKQYGEVTKARQSIVKELTTLKLEPAETKDDHSIILSANIEGIDELDAVLEYGAHGVGLFRSEYLVMSKGETLDEDEQAEIFSDVAAKLNPAPVIIRTLDLGGDKVAGNENYIVEANPFLGCRSIRLSLSNPEEFKSQLRAILRASIHGDVKIMYPMISSVTEVIQANALLEEAKEELRQRNVGFNKDIDVGIMIEVPSAALTVDIIADHVQFFSIGTNDLVQYTLAVDRVNERVAYLYQPTHPAIIKLIRETVSVAHKKGAWVGLCGEMAADPLMTPLLLGMGLDELSVPPSAVPLVKDVIRNIRFTEAVELVENALECKEAEEIEQLCRQLTKRVAPELLELI
jgi:phosphotransferase system enzyme I (PtsI)